VGDVADVPEVHAAFILRVEPARIHAYVSSFLKLKAAYTSKSSVTSPKYTECNNHEQN
jgi:hypothetical protein